MYETFSNENWIKSSKRNRHLRTNTFRILRELFFSVESNNSRNHDINTGLDIHKARINYVLFAFRIRGKMQANVCQTNDYNKNLYIAASLLLLSVVNNLKTRSWKQRSAEWSQPDTWGRDLAAPCRRMRNIHFPASISHFALLLIETSR